MRSEKKLRSFHTVSFEKKRQTKSPRNKSIWVHMSMQDSTDWVNTYGEVPNEKTMAGVQCANPKDHRAARKRAA